MRPAVLLLAALALALGTGVAACIHLEPEAHYCAAPADSPPAARALTYHADVEPVLAKKCMRCHGNEGPGPVRLLAYDEVAASRERIRAEVTAGRMPPWPPASCCATYRDALALTDDERAAILGWIDQGAPEGPGSATPPAVARGKLDRVDTVLEMPVDYLPAPEDGETDETRCFLLPWNASETRYVTGMDVQPGDGPQVHHALVLTASAEDAEHLRALDDASSGPGFPCPGGLVGHFKDFLGGGFFQAQSFPEGTGHEILPTDSVVLQMHYSVPARGTFVRDRTKVLLRHQREPVTRLVALTLLDPAWLLGGFRIPANERDVTFGWVDAPTEVNGDRPFLIHSLNLHMHERGARGQIAILRKNGDRDCLLQIDAWQHHWQGDYVLAEPKRLEPGDRLMVSCTFDNTAGHQKLVGGLRETPRTLGWKEDEEMCVGFVTATRAE